MEKEKLWTKNFITATSVNFLLVLNYYLLVVIIADYSIKHFKVSASIAGLATSMFVIGALFARFFAAKLMELFNQKTLLIICSSLITITSCTYLFVPNIYILCFIRLFHGIIYGISSTVITTLVTNIIPKKRYGAGIGYFMLSVTLGTAIGPFLGMFLTNTGEFFNIFISCIIIALFCLIGSLILKTPNTQAIVKNKNINKPKDFKSLFEIKVFPICAVCAGIYFSYSGIVSFLSTYSNEINLQFIATFFFIIYSTVILLSRPFTGRLFDAKGERVAMIPAFISFFIGLLLLSQANNGIMLLLSAIFSGYGVGVIQSCGLAIAVKDVSKERLSYVNSTYYIFIDSGMGIGPVLLGFLIPFVGYRGMYLLISIFVLILTFIYLIISKNKH